MARIDRDFAGAKAIEKTENAILAFSVFFFESCRGMIAAGKPPDAFSEGAGGRMGGACRPRPQEGLRQGGRGYSSDRWQGESAKAARAERVFLPTVLPMKEVK